jgi:hypothetical protein
MPLAEPELSDKGLPLKLVRSLDHTAGVVTGGGSADTFEERLKAALKDMEENSL